MQDALLLAVLALTAVLGYYLMKRLDYFLLHHVLPPDKPDEDKSASEFSSPVMPVRVKAKRKKVWRRHQSFHITHV